MVGRITMPAALPEMPVQIFALMQDDQAWSRSVPFVVAREIYATEEVSFME